MCLVVRMTVSSLSMGLLSELGTYINYIALASNTPILYESMKYVTEISICGLKY